MSKSKNLSDKDIQEAARRSIPTAITEHPTIYLDEMIKARAERDGYRNGQLQVQNILDGVMRSNTALATDVKALREQVRALRKAGSGLLRVVLENWREEGWSPESSSGQAPTDELYEVKRMRAVLAASAEQETT